MLKGKQGEKKMKLGIIGTNWITGSFIDATELSKAMRLTAVYSRTEEKAKQFANRYGARETYTDVEKMAKSNSIDCVYIASPNALHYEQALLFLKHKKHVICEKPIFSNTKELREASRVAEENGVYLFEAMRNIHMPNFYKLEESLNKVGRLRSAVLTYAKYSSRYDNVLNGEEPNIFSLDFSGGALVDLGVYPVAAAVSLFGKPESIVYSTVIIRTGVDGSGTLVLNYLDFTCTIICSKITTSFVDSEIHGEKGTLSIDNMGSLSELAFTAIHTDEKRLIGTEQMEAAMFYEIEKFAEIIQTNNRQEYESLLQLSHDVLEITEEARRQNGIVYRSER